MSRRRNGQGLKPSDVGKVFYENEKAFTVKNFEKHIHTKPWRLGWVRVPERDA